MARIGSPGAMGDRGGVSLGGGLGVQEINFTCWKGGISKERFSSYCRKVALHLPQLGP